MPKISPTQRIIAQSCLHKMSDRGTPLHLQVKEPFDRNRAKLGKIIHDPSEANDLWESQKERVVIHKTRPFRPGRGSASKKKPIIANAPMSNEWNR